MKSFKIQFWPIIAICLAAFCFFQNSSHNEEIDSLKAQIEALEKSLDEANSSYEEESNKYTYEIDELEAEVERLTAKNASLSDEVVALQEQKLIPVHYCAHSESSVITQIRLLLDDTPNLEGEYSCEYGNHVSEDQVSWFYEWVSSLEDVVGYNSIEFSRYMSLLSLRVRDGNASVQDQNIYYAYEDNCYEKGQDMATAFANAMVSTNNGAVSTR